MTSQPATTRPLDNRLHCPQCGAPVDRISRRWVDRIFSFVTRSRRFRCQSMICGWEGNLRVKRGAVIGTSRRYERRIDAP